MIMYLTLMIRSQTIIFDYLMSHIRSTLTLKFAFRVPLTHIFIFFVLVLWFDCRRAAADYEAGGPCWDEEVVSERGENGF